MGLRIDVIADGVLGSASEGREAASVTQSMRRAKFLSFESRHVGGQYSGGGTFAGSLPRDVVRVSMG